MSRNSKSARLHREARARKGQAGPSSTQPQHGKRNRVARGGCWWAGGKQERRSQPALPPPPPAFVFEAKGFGVTLDMTSDHGAAYSAYAASKCTSKAMYRIESGVKTLLMSHGVF